MKELTLKNTKQREIIINSLRSLKTHPTADELYFKIKKIIPCISLSTVYRNLENFYKLGLINKINNNPVRYDARKDQHHHLKCIKCGKIYDFDVQTSIIDEKIFNNLNFKIHDYKIEINCTCNKCLSK